MDYSFRGELNGFRRSEVIACIQELLQEKNGMQEKLSALTRENERLTAQLQEQETERETLRGQLSALRAELQGKAEETASLTAMQQDELSAYRRAEALERQARQCAEALEREARQRAAELTARADESLREANARIAQLRVLLLSVRGSLGSADGLLDDAVSALTLPEVQEEAQ